MCGIIGALGLDPERVEDVREKTLRLPRTLRHRGPDWSSTHAQLTAALGPERLAIVDPLSGDQPLLDPSGQIALAVNGGIDKHRALQARLEAQYPFRTESDCEVILPLYLEKGEGFVSELDGMLASVLSDARTGQPFAARDPTCSTAAAIAWGEQFRNNVDPSGRAVGVHADAYGQGESA